jgi:uncharacterized protein (TIGR03435 family)
MRMLALIALLGIAQARPAFEVASVKLGQPDAGFSGGCHGIDSRYAANQAASAPPLGRCVIRDARLGHLLFIAYRLNSMSLVKGGPDWVKTGDFRFNVEAKAEDPTKATEAELYQMLQTLLTERFSLKFHREIKELPGFALLVGKNGPKLKDAQGDEVSAVRSPPKPSSGLSNTLIARGQSMQMLADQLSIFGDPVMDKTGLTGVYDFKLFWNEDEGPSLASALQQQLGLRYESQKVPVS